MTLLFEKIQAFGEVEKEIYGAWCVRRISVKNQIDMLISVRPVAKCSGMEISVKNNADALIFHTAICAENVTN